MSEHHHHSHHHSETTGKVDETGIFRQKMSKHVHRVRWWRRILTQGLYLLTALVVFAVIFAYIIDRG